MNESYIKVLKILKGIYSHIMPSPIEDYKSIINDIETSSDLIKKMLSKDEPCMITRFGSNELTCLSNYVGTKEHKYNFYGYIKGETLAWWWNKNILNQMEQNAGFFPPTVEKIEQFCKLMLDDIKEVDILGSWLIEEKYFDANLFQATKVKLALLEPYKSRLPWTSVLEGKKILVVHPFQNSIIKQYKIRKKLFDDENFLPEFELKTIKAVQSIAGEKTIYKDWFEALEYMKSEIDKVDYDICLIGCGAYGFPLAAHVKRTGKKAFHIGGSLQLLFGIKGKRWESDKSIGNKFWVFPDNSETPKNSSEVEDSCYW